ncbi:gliding motility-associated C-terminal domain-containing protein [Aquimarina agarivorans]|uniref:gliding motility-associated C-terminal domain-containing protein n=1 Tax=Aquimarina agarivorans TaxID=980584 RepID=UPI000248E97D|nr:gliding motility-associated C-terminal domain-containing protein [Aquimarina agarivorans]
MLSTTYPESEVTITTADPSVYYKTIQVTKEEPILIDLSISLGNTTLFNVIEKSKGLLITATNPIQAVHINDSPHNKTYTVLKGSSALGKNFYAASQTKVLNEQYKNGETHFISVMATENETDITIEMPANKVLDGIGNSITIRLNAYETYLVKNIDGTNSINNITGTHITSNKDIAVISGAQHVRQNKGIGGAAEGGVDQLVPTKILGTEYILSRGGTALDYAIVIASEPNTKIYLDDSSEVKSLSNAGDFIEVDYSKNTRRKGLDALGTPHYIHSDKPIYVFHVSGLMSDEVGMALIPTVGCTGSKTINFLKFKSGINIATVIIEDEGISNFNFNGKSIDDLGLVIKKIPGKDGWSVVSIPDTEINDSNIAVADSFFHLGLLVASPGSGTYGMLSGFEKNIRALDPIEKLPTTEFIIEASCNLRNEKISIPLELEVSCGEGFITAVTTDKEGSAVELVPLGVNKFQLDYTAGILSDFNTDTITVSFESRNNDVFQASGSVNIAIVIPSNANKDSDNLPDCIDPDDDNDGILDVDEYPIIDANPFGDEDGDAIQNFQDVTDNGNSGDDSITDYSDINADGVPDIYDFDNDGQPNHIDLDSDNDGIPDNVEAQLSAIYMLPSNSDVDDNGIDDSYGEGLSVANTVASTFPDFVNIDSDNDGFNDVFEAFYINENQQNSIFIGDTDKDGLDDFFDAEVGSFKFPNGAQVLINPIDDLKNTDASDEPDYRDLDDDNDAIATMLELEYQTDPYIFDTDQDGLSDGEEITGVDNLETMFVANVKSDPNNICDPLKQAPSCDQDGDGNSNGLDPNPTKPVAEDDFILIKEGQTIDGFFILENDDFLIGPNTHIANTGNGTAQGEISLISSVGKFNYVPKADELGVVTVIYEVCHSVEDLKVCTTATIEITIEEEKDLKIYNAISPNNDGKNDYFIIEGITSLEDFPYSDVMIFNSNGEIVYKETDYKGGIPFGLTTDISKSFYGQAKGSLVFQDNEELPRGTYFYEVNYTLASGAQKVKTGYLYLNR